jgi:hypothetical protein
MAHQDAGTSAATTTKAKRRKWRNRRPPWARLDLTPEQRKAEEEKRRAKLRTAHIGVQFTPAERAEIVKRAKASGISLSDFVRIVLLSDLKAPAPPAHDLEAIRDLSVQLSKVGTNLNQLAKLANECRAMPHQAELKPITDQIASLFAKILDL